MKNKKSTQNLFGLRTFGKYGLLTERAGLAFFSVQPTNISVLSTENIDVKIHHLMTLLSMIPELEMICLDSCECFDGNKQNIRNRLKTEENPKVRKLLEQDMAFLDDIQIEMSTARQFLFCIRFKDKKDEQIFQQINRVSKVISEHGFEVRRMNKNDIKRMLAIYFEASMHGEELPDVEGENYLEAGEPPEAFRA